MDSHQLKVTLAREADDALLALIQEVRHMLTLLEEQLSEPEAATRSPIIQLDLQRMVKTLGTLPSHLANFLHLWKQDQIRILSVDGVQLNLLNELWITLGVTLNFLMESGINPSPYNHLKARAALTHLGEVNRCIQ